MIAALMLIRGLLFTDWQNGESFNINLCIHTAYLGAFLILFRNYGVKR